MNGPEGPFNFSVHGSECVWFDRDGERQRERDRGHQLGAGTRQALCLGEALGFGAQKSSSAFAGVLQIQHLLFILFYALPARVNSGGCFYKEFREASECNA